MLCAILQTICDLNSDWRDQLLFLMYQTKINIIKWIDDKFGQFFWNNSDKKS